MGNLFTSLLGLFVGLFLADAAVSLLDDTLILFADVHVLTGIRGMLSLFALFMAFAIYGLMGVTPTIPKWFFLPLALFNPVAGLVSIPFLIYHYERIQQVAWAISFYQLLLGLGLLYKIRGGFNFSGPLFPESKLPALRFSWRNLAVFLSGNLFVLLPVVVVYLGWCATLAVDHFSAGFLALRPEGLTVQVRKYVRPDGRTIQLVPMTHIGEPEFYQKLAQSFPTNSTILMEGVTDEQGRLTNRISYQRMATSLGVAEQQKEFKPRGRVVPADVDVGQFTTNTINFLNLVMLVQTKGVDDETGLKLMQYSEPAHFQQQLFNDLLSKRNRHLWQEIQARLPQSENLIVPWGAAHMPELARLIQKAGFRVIEAQEYVAIRFHSTADKHLKHGEDAAQPK